jgi:hypothetical protein
MADFDVSSLMRIAREVTLEQSLPLKVAGVVFSGGGDYVEILINIDGCKSDPCQFAIGAFRDASEDELRDEIAFQLRRALEDHRALYAPVDRSSTSQISAAS